MSLEKIHLPDAVIATLYKSPLIEGEQERREKALPAKQPVEPVVEASYKILGSNGQSITMIVDFPDEVFLPDQHLQFLTRMLEACKMNLGDVAILNKAAAAITIERVKEQLQPKYVLLFGVETGDIGLPFSFPFFKEQEHGGCIYLSTPPLNDLNQETEEGKLLKSKLWVCLRKLFGV